MSDMWKSYKDHLSLSLELYGPESLIQTNNIADAAFNGGIPTFRFNQEGKGNDTKLVGIIKTLLSEPVSIRETKHSEEYVFLNDTTYLSLIIRKQRKKGNRQCEVDVVTQDKSIFDVIKKEASKLIEENPPSNQVFALVTTQRGLSLTALGEFKQKLITHNYADDAVTSYNHIKSCLGSKDPCGRLVLLQGAPGTGKSYMIRSLVSEVDSTFVVVGSNMISDLSGPTILPVLMGAVEMGKPITFILEDADVALTHRTKGGMTHLSGLLNLGDGLLGEMLDIRIIATTNAGKLDLDAAITRPGRMCQHISFENLSVSDATALYTKLAKKPTETIKKPLTLAEVYRMARQDGWVAPKSAEKQGQYL